MKKARRPETKAAAAAAPEKSTAWWPWAAAGIALFLIYEIYGPSMNGPFVLDDRYLPYFSARPGDRFSDWVGLLRPALMFSYWINFQMAGAETLWYHATNVLIHFLTSSVAVLIAAKLAEWAGVSGRTRWALAIFCGAVFLAHPLQVEAVAYTAGRSDALSTLFYYGAFAVFLWRRDEAIGLAESMAVLALFALAMGTKENTLTLPALLLLTDYFWGRGGIVKNRILYGLLGVAAAAGGVMVWGVIKNQATAGFKTEGMTPATFFFTECRVVWSYIRLFFVPAGQNVDPDIAISRTIMDHAAIVGLIGIAGLIAAAWVYRKQFPLASFGVLTFLLLISPVATIVPIKDVMSERRVYLPMIGLLLVCCEFLRRANFSRIAQIGAAVVILCSVLTYKRAEVWASPVALWGDAVEKSPEKYRPRFQLAFAQFERQQCAPASQNYEAASKLQPPDNELLVDWALALDCTGRMDDALEKLRLAMAQKETAHLHTQIARELMRKQQWGDALAELSAAERLKPNYDMTYVYRGNIFQIRGDRAAATREFQRALELNPENEIARGALATLANGR